jgi:hypothetical protein
VEHPMLGFSMDAEIYSLANLGVMPILLEDTKMRIM